LKWKIFPAKTKKDRLQLFEAVFWYSLPKIFAYKSFMRQIWGWNYISRRFWQKNVIEGDFSGLDTNFGD